MRGASSRDGKRQSRLIRGNEDGFDLLTVDHLNGGAVRLDATVTYCCNSHKERQQVLLLHHRSTATTVKTAACYTPQPQHRVVLPTTTTTTTTTTQQQQQQTIVNPNGEAQFWFELRDGAVLGAQNGMLLEYEASTLAPLGMVVSRDELRGRRVAVLDDGFGGDVVVLYSDEEACVVQPNEDGTYWRRIVRNKLHRTREQRRARAATAFLSRQGVATVVRSSYGPYTNAAGQAMGISTRPHPFTEKELLSSSSSSSGQE